MRKILLLSVIIMLILVGCQIPRNQLVVIEPDEGEDSISKHLEEVITEIIETQLAYSGHKSKTFAAVEIYGTEEDENGIIHAYLWAYEVYYTYTNGELERLTSNSGPRIISLGEDRNGILQLFDGRAIDSTERETIRRDFPANYHDRIFSRNNVLDLEWIVTQRMENYLPEIREQAEKLFVAYLQSYMGENMDLNSRLIDFRIDDLSVTHPTRNGFVFEASFSVQPTVEDTLWLGGSGEYNSLGWVNDKNIFVFVEKDNNQYSIDFTIDERFGLVELDRTWWLNINPQLSPDKKYLLSLQDGVFTLHNFPEGTLVETFVPDKAVVTAFDWSPQGDQFAYAAESEEERNVFIVGIDGKSKLVATLEPSEFSDKILIWSPCGQYLFWDKPFSLYNIETGELTVREEIDNNHSYVRNVLFSDNGRQLAFTLFADDGSENLWLLNVNEGTVRQVTDFNDGDYPFSWVDDTTLMVQIGGVSTGGGHVYGLAAVDLKTNKRKILDEETGRLNVASTISPDGKQVLGNSSDGAGADSKIYIMDVETKQRDYLLEGYTLSQALWVSKDEVLVTVRKQEEISDGSYLMQRYTVRDGVVPLVESKTELRILSEHDGLLHYLKADAVSFHWFWQTLDYSDSEHVR
jgi:Tol biopolymer transport system component